MTNSKLSFLTLLMNKSSIIAGLFLVLAFIGFFDATYLTVKHFLGAIPPCSIVEGCEKVLTSEYAVIAGIPIALVGSIYYSTLFLLTIFSFSLEGKKYFILASRLSVLGFLVSLWLVYLQLFVVKAVCLYCVFSAVVSMLLFCLGALVVLRERRRLIESLPVSEAKV